MSQQRKFLRRTRELHVAMHAQLATRPPASASMWDAERSPGRKAADERDTAPEANAPNDRFPVAVLEQLRAGAQRANPSATAMVLERPRRELAYRASNNSLLESERRGSHLARRE